MFDIGWSELVVIAVVALIAIGPKELPAVLRTVGQYMGKVRRMASEFQDQFREAMREAEMADLKKQVDEITSAAQDLTRFDPIAEGYDEVKGALADKPAEAAAAPPEAIVPAPDHAAVAPEAPQPAAEPNSEPKPASGSGA